MHLNKLPETDQNRTHLDRLLTNYEIEREVLSHLKKKDLFDKLL